MCSPCHDQWLFCGALSPESRCRGPCQDFLPICCPSQGGEALLGHMANITVLEQPWVTDQHPVPSGIAVLHPRGSPFMHGHFLPRSYLSFQVLDTSGHSVSDFCIKTMAGCPGSYGEKIQIRQHLPPLLPCWPGTFQSAVQTG